MSCTTPVVFIIFRRPDLTRQVFEAIRQAQPGKLLIIADGPRNPDEAVLCREAQAVTEQVDWPCEVLRNYSDVNMGARRRISKGLDWVFEQVDEAIILEDDCLPHPSFFDYCTELLARYRDDNRIFCISGDNFQRGRRRGDGSYYFSNYPHTWGWATWRRAWCQYDHEMTGWPALRDGRYLEGLLDDPLEVKYWRTVFETLYTLGRPDAWDYIWIMTCWKNHALTVLPNVNLVSNVGFRNDATNTKSKSGTSENIRMTADIGLIRHPSVLTRDVDADRYTFDHVFGGAGMRNALRWQYRFRRRLWIVKQKLLNRPVK